MPSRRPENMLNQFTSLRQKSEILYQDTVEMINMCDLDWPWWAPECLQDHLFDIVTDIWAFGCVIFEINHDGLGPYAFQRKRPQSHNE
ncbi:hypothetical protein COOONC_09559 [Cooperia oncophora]